MANFIKSGDRIIPKAEGLDYDVMSGKIYQLKFDDWNDQLFLVETNDIKLPSKIYSTKEEELFVKRVLDYYNTTEQFTTGVLLCGEKGTGKTIMAKRIAIQSGLPVVLIDINIPGRMLNEFFSQFKIPVCMLFDEVEKNMNTEKLLEFLDGMTSTYKKLVLMTCNHEDKISEFMIDRCSRIRYIRRFTMKNNLEYISQVIQDFDIKHKDETIKFIKEKIKYPSIDNIKCFLNEIEYFKETDLNLEDIIKFLNIKLKE